MVLRSITRLTFLPPIQEEDEYLPALPHSFHRHDYIVKNGFVDEKGYAVDHLVAKAYGIEVIHDGVLPDASLADMSKDQVGFDSSFFLL